MTDPAPMSETEGTLRMDATTNGDSVAVQMLLANLITTHRSYMTDEAYLTHIELADLMLQALDVEGYSIVKSDEPLLGLATTSTLLEELGVRFEVGGQPEALALIQDARTALTLEELDYRTVDS